MAIDVENRLAGIMVPVFALRRPHDLGIGDTTAVREAIDFCARNQIGLLQLLPINETGGDHSPYNAISSIALDPALLDTTPEAIPYIDAEYFANLASESNIERLREGPVDYPRVKRLKHSLLENAFSNFKAKGTVDASEQFARFRSDNSDWLDNYVIFRTLVACNNDDARWPMWPDEWRSPAQARVWIQQSPRQVELTEQYEFRAFVQFLAFQQWLAVKEHADRKNVALMGDIPFGISHYSADTWEKPQLFDLAGGGGAPPEALFQGDDFTRNWGQNWGIPLYKWDEHRQENFAWWRNRVKHTTAIFNYFRIDHVLGFYRVYRFPWIADRNAEFATLSEEEARALTGGELPRFVPRDDSSAENQDLNCAEGTALLKEIIAASCSAGVVAEDLGVVPNYVRPSLTELGIPGFAIPSFDRFYDTDRSYIPKEQMPKLKLGTWGTHDHVPLITFYENLVSWWHGPNGDEGWHEIQRLMRFLELDENNPPTTYDFALLQSFFASLLTAPCWLAVFMVTDLLALRIRFNEPALANAANWSQRLELPLTEYERQEPYCQYITAFRALILASNRAPKTTLSGAAADVLSSS